MSLLNNIKKTCPSTTTFIKKLLSIKDDNITFPTFADALSEEIVHGVPSKVFSGLLSYPENPYCYPECGVIGSVERILKSYTYEVNPYTYQNYLNAYWLMNSKERKIVIQNFAIFLVMEKLGKLLIF
ncbi:hypothetical protein CIRMBP1279_01692 [Enterococcus cecorum]|nr:hypothetical protein [Enterococcus cecorum]CAI3253726.1 hypothetical protein CIRMBP1283_00042 [Enterococcus cecorum]CAI3408199.1 hypothetical protein CIRMBP1280_01708 [Enterococcus cecorum]CAI3420847.1 hypothetical protein CIRMBP1279_01692 [Enterococcus cecorum]CAI3428495.1 hypothetical protein CIRMBP1278_01598 [Enterococcus cecorum]CAI3428795.1 hypothetical protein CIRMBP1285_01765 [Enterococcus cecorum]